MAIDRTADGARLVRYRRHAAWFYIVAAYAIAWTGVWLIVSPYGFPGSPEALNKVYGIAFVAMAAGRLHVSGSPEDVLTEDTVRHVFGLECRIVTDPTSGRPTMLPIGRHRMVAGKGRKPNGAETPSTSPTP